MMLSGLAILLLFAFSIGSAQAAAKAGIIRIDGTWVVNPKIGSIITVGDDRFVYSDFNPAGKNCTVRLVEPSGQVKILPQSEQAPIRCGRFAPAIALIRTKPPEVLFYSYRNGKSGLVSETGQIMIPTEFDSLGEIAEGHLVGLKALSFKTGQIFVFDENGNCTGKAQCC